MKTNPNPKSKINWENIHLQMNDLHEKLAQATYLTPDEKRSILISRAQELAAESMEKNNQREVIKSLRIRLANEINGIETENDRDAISLIEMPNDHLFMLDSAYLLIDKNSIVNEEMAH